MLALVPTRLNGNAEAVRRFEALAGGKPIAPVETTTATTNAKKLVVVIAINDNVIKCQNDGCRTFVLLVLL